MAEREREVARRGSGEGAIYPHRGRWEVALDMTEPGGRRVRRRRSARTKSEALAKLRELQRQAVSGVVAPGNLTLEQYLREWFKNVLPSRGVTLKTRENYEWAINSHLIPSLGKVKLAQLRAEHVDRLLREMIAAGLARNSAMRARAVLVSALDHAERRDYVAKNVARLAVLPPGPRKERRSLTVAEAKRLLEAAEGDRLEAAWTTMLLAGLRPGEACGLTWDSVDLERGTLRVTQALREEGGRLVLGEPKTATSLRTLDLPDRVVKALRSHRALQAAEQLAAGPLWQENGLVFATTIGTPIDRHNFRRSFLRVTTAAGIGAWHPHELRHSTVSLLSAAGVPLEQIADVVGHSTTRMTGTVYRHAVTPSVGSHVSTMDKLFGS